VNADNDYHRRQACRSLPPPGVLRATSSARSGQRIQREEAVVAVVMAASPPGALGALAPGEPHELSAFCLVTGLTSPAGQALNGVAGRVKGTLLSEDGDQQQRVAVLLNGVTQGKSLRRSNLRLIAARRFWIAVGVAREETGGLDGSDPTRPDDLFFNVVNRTDGQRIGLGDLGPEMSATCGRSCGNLLAACSVLEPLQGRALEAPVHLMLTDLNVCRAINRAALGAEEPPVAPHAVVAPPLAVAHRAVRALVAQGGQVLASFDPHRCLPDNESLATKASSGVQEDVASERIHAALHGAVCFYPSVNPRRPGCVEVRYLGQPADPCACLTSRHERFIDYGREEAIAYIKFAAALGDVARLRPLTLAAVDPQAFWAALLRADAFVRALENTEEGSECGGPSLVEEWQALAAGVQRGLEACLRLGEQGTTGFRPWDTHGTWEQHVVDAGSHSEVAFQGAMTGVLLTTMAGGLILGPVEGQDNGRQSRGIRFTILDEDRGTPFGRTLEALAAGRAPP
jgi:hypothetical protein